MRATSISPSIELLKEPYVEVDNSGNTYHVLVARNEVNSQGESEPNAVGQIVETPRHRWIYGIAKPETSTIDTQIRGMVGRAVIYDKIVAPRNKNNLPIPFYGLRVAISKKRAAKQVLSTLFG